MREDEVRLLFCCVQSDKNFSFEGINVTEPERHLFAVLDEVVGGFEFCIKTGQL